MKTSELKGKHDHALTNWLKVIIFSLLMIAPLFASISQWIYVSCNRNAKDSYSGKNVEAEEIIETTYDDLIIGNTYQAFMTETTNTFTQLVVNASNVKNISNNVLYPDIIQLTFTKTNVNYIVGNDGTNNFYFNSNTIQFTYGGTIQEGTAYEYTTFNKIIFNDSAYLDNAFYYGVEKMTESDLFNWTQNTTLYSGIKTMTDNLEIQTPAIAILLTYWFILTIIYVIIDIVLKGFTTLTHLIMGAK